LIEGLQGAGPVMADAACDADHLRHFNESNPGAVAQIKRNPQRSTTQTIDQALYKGCHLFICLSCHRCGDKALMLP